MKPAFRFMGFIHAEVYKQEKGLNINWEKYRRIATLRGTRRRRAMKNVSLPEIVGGLASMIIGQRWLLLLVPLETTILHILYLQ